MRASLLSLILAIALAALVLIAERNPYATTVHGWQISLVVALIGLVLVVQFFASLRQGFGPERFAAVGALGGAVMALAFVVGELLVGPPQRVVAAPGQTYRPPHSNRLALEFPPVSAGDLTSDHSNDSISVVVGNERRALSVGEELRVHSYVLRADPWPAAYVRAWSPAHASQTVTQPTSSTFVSPVLQFPDEDLSDSFAVPALHREVRVRYYPGLPSRGIDIPFLQLEIDEENGGVLFGGVTVSGRPVRQAGMELVFELGTYPVVSMAGAPDRLAVGIGMLLLAAGVIGFAISQLSSVKQKRTS